MCPPARQYYPLLILPRADHRPRHCAGGDTRAVSGTLGRSAGRLHVTDGGADGAPLVHGRGAGSDAHACVGQHRDALAGDGYKRKLVGTGSEHGGVRAKMQWSRRWGA